MKTPRKAKDDHAVITKIGTDGTIHVRVGREERVMRLVIQDAGEGLGMLVTAVQPA